MCIRDRIYNERTQEEFQKALSLIEEKDYIERYAFFPPTTQVANFFDDNNNFTQIGEFYYNFNSSASIPYETHISTSNLNSESYNLQQIECNPDYEFLSINSKHWSYKRFLWR